MNTTYDEWGWDFGTEANVSTAALDTAINAAKVAYYNSYKETEQVDLLHRDNYWNELESLRSAASSLPTSTLSSFLESSEVANRYIYTSNPYMLYKEKTVEYGTLFEEEQVESLEEWGEDTEPLAAVVIGTRQETDYDRVMDKFKARMVRRGLTYWAIQDLMSWANEQYALLLIEKSGQEPSWYAQRLMWILNDEHKHRQTKKYKNSEEREVELVMTEEDKMPVETTEVEHLLTHEDYVLTLSRTQLKTWDDCIEWARESGDEPMPKKLKQRLARLPKTDGAECMTVERVTRYNDNRSFPAGWDLKESIGRDFEVKTGIKSRLTANGYVKGVGLNA
ncbi:hypothetical protein M2284_004118 [Rhodococcus sp. LBL1]|nr:hypothetical protein [Rhodococcus sp. LBL1]MDH6684723.1 hypothetical protein [Rhodococcus sp. LBL2]